MAGNGQGWATEKGVVLVDRDKGQGSVWRAVKCANRLWGSECVTPQDRCGCERTADRMLGPGTEVVTGFVSCAQVGPGTVAGQS